MSVRKRNDAAEFGNLNKVSRTMPDASKNTTSITPDSPLSKESDASIPFICEISLFNKPPVDSIVRLVADLIGRHIENPNVEIEAKLGILIDRNSDSRLKLPILSEAAIVPDRNVRFKSDMSLGQHHHFNQMLNNRVNESNRPGYPGKVVSYQHTYERDCFYNSNNSKIRVTFDSQTNRIKEGGIIVKNKLEHIDISSPLNNLDFRVSINEEIPRSKPTGTPQHERNKDRLSYKHDLWQIDLTQVKTQNSDSRNSHKEPEVSHEVEIEIANLDVIREEYKNMRQNKPSQYYHFIQVFLNNIRLLAHYSRKD